MGEGNHSSEQGLRVHYLANLGGLVVLAGLDLEPPDFLLGALLSVAREATALSPQQRAEIAAMGQVKLDERATGKRAWTAFKENAGTQVTAGIFFLQKRAPGAPPTLPTDIETVKEGALAERNGALVIRNGERFEPANLPASVAARVRGMMGIRDTVRSLFQSQLDDAPEER